MRQKSRRVVAVIRLVWQKIKSFSSIHTLSKHLTLWLSNNDCIDNICTPMLFRQHSLVCLLSLSLFWFITRSVYHVIMFLRTNTIELMVVVRCYQVLTDKCKLVAIITFLIDYKKGFNIGQPIHLVNSQSGFIRKSSSLCTSISQYCTESFK